MAILSGTATSRHGLARAPGERQLARDESRTVDVRAPGGYAGGVSSRSGVLTAIALALTTSILAAGPHDATVHHPFDDPEQWSKVFDDPGRDAWQKPHELVDALHLQPGQRVADLGAGTGYFSRVLSAAVGADGTVFAVELEPNLVTHLRDRAEREHTKNVVPVLASADDPRLPTGSVDVVLIVDTYHHVDDRITYFRSLRRALRPAGRVAIVDWQKRPLPVGPEMDHKLARETVVDEMAEAGYRLADEPTFLPYQYFLVFAPR
jgi:ubiquinone/menaquinone biosynthesis C-methylase UbiE